MKTRKITVDQYLLTGSELAEWLDLSPGRITQLTDKGVLEKDEKTGLYDLQFSVISYSRFLLAPHMFD
jgi:hypothetical protein